MTKMQILRVGAIFLLVLAIVRLVINTLRNDLFEVYDQLTMIIFSGAVLAATREEKS